jgi:hypothetical protein
MSQQHDDYISKKADYDAATKNVTDLILRLQSFVAPLFENWQTCYIEVFGGDGPPMAMVAERRCKVDGNNLPSVAELQKALVAQFAAQQEGHRAWTSIPATERQELKSPPWLKRL